MERVSDAPAAWTNPVHGLATGHTSNTQMTTPVLSNNSTPLGRSRISADAVNLTMTGLIYASTTGWMMDTIPYSNAVEQWPLLDVGVYCNTVGHRGRKGKLIDMWWCGNDVSVRHFVDGVGPYALARFGALALPWNGELPYL